MSTNSKYPGLSFDDDDLGMKRNIHSIQAVSPESTMSTSELETNLSKRKGDTKLPTSLTTNDYWKEKAKNLQNPFAEELKRGITRLASHDVRENGINGHDYSGRGLNGFSKPRPAALDLSRSRPIDIPGLKDINVHLETPPFDVSEDVNCKDIGYDKTIKLPPLPNSTISDILLQTKSHCSKAQAWTKAEQVSEETQERWLEKTKNGLVEGLDRREQMHLKMTIALMLAQKARENRQAKFSHLAYQLRKAHLDLHGQRNLPGRRLDGSPKTFDDKMELDTVEEEWEERNLTRKQRVHRAHDRLRKALRLEER